MAAISAITRFDSAIGHIFKADHLRNVGQLGDARKELTQALKTIRSVDDHAHVGTAISDIQLGRSLMKSPDNGGDPMKGSSWALSGARQLELARGAARNEEAMAQFYRANTVRP